MNEFHSSTEWKYRPRLLADQLRDGAGSHPVVVLTGARQVGKSTLLQEEPPFDQWRYLTLDDYGVLDTARREPEELWAGAERIVLDEVQKSPELLSSVKLAVDRSRRRMRFAGWP